MRYHVHIGDQKYSLREINHHTGSAQIDGRMVQFDFQHVRGSLYSLIVDGQVFSAHVESDQEATEICRGPHLLRVAVEDERAALLRQLARGESSTAAAIEIKAPMPGLVVRLLVQTGAAVKKGQSVAVIEAMKMENDIKAPLDAVVTAVHVAERIAVEKNTRLITLAVK